MLAWRICGDVLRKDLWRRRPAGRRTGMSCCWRTHDVDRWRRRPAARRTRTCSRQNQRDAGRLRGGWRRAAGRADGGAGYPGQVPGAICMDGIGVRTELWSRLRAGEEGKMSGSENVGGKQRGRQQQNWISWKWRDLRPEGWRLINFLDPKLNKSDSNTNFRTQI
jgi:hypothetical protein